MDKFFHVIENLFRSHGKGWSRTLNIVDELAAGKLILVDSGIHSPVQRWMREIAMWDQFLNRKTVEIRSWSEWWSSHPNFKKFLRRENDVDVIRAELISYLGLVANPSAIWDWPSSVVEASADAVQRSILSTRKTVMKFRYHAEEEISQIEQVLSISIEVARSLAQSGDEVPLFMIEIGSLYDTARIRSLIHELHDTGAQIVVIRLVDWPTSTSDMKADIHIIERTPFLDYLYDESEVLMRTGEYASLAPFYKTTKRPGWLWKPSQPRDFPSISEYNADPENFMSKR